MTPERDTQRKLLIFLAGRYPIEVQEEDPLWPVDDTDERVRAVAYLEEHRLVAARWSELLGDDGERSFDSVRATAAGLDFLADDGGLTAILGKVTIRIDEDQLRALILGAVERGEASETVKAQLTETIRGLPASALRAVAERAIQAGVQKVPDLLSLLHIFAGS